MEFFGAKCPLDKIDADDVHAWMEWLRRRSGRRSNVGLSDSAVRHYLNALSNLYRYAELERAVAPGYNPAATVRQQLDSIGAARQQRRRVDDRIAAGVVLDDARRVLPFLKAIADERRLRILVLLSGNERSVGELQTALQVGQSLLSFHLSALKDVGLVSDRREGRKVYYALDAKVLLGLETFLRKMRCRERCPGPSGRLGDEGVESTGSRAERTARDQVEI